MKSLPLALVLVCVAACSSPTDKPVAGKTYALVYDPSHFGILSDAKQITVTYAFDYWGTRELQKLKGEPGKTDLFQNVLYPDSGRALEVRMAKDGNLWKAEIPVPKGAALLSYYFTDGTRYDYNGRRTYVSYIYGTDGNPVRGARFRNVDFLIMAGSGLPALLAELQSEVQQYPDQYVAHLVYWRFRFFDTISPDTLGTLAAEADGYFDNLRKQFGDVALNYKVMSLNEINRVIQLSLSERLSDPPVAALLKSVNTKIIETIDAIPRDKRLPSMAQIASHAAYMQEDYQKMVAAARESNKRVGKTIGQFVGKNAPDFSFETVEGKKHRLSEFRGHNILLEFWGSWCGPCRMEIPTLVKVYEKYHDRGLVMISISNDASMSKWNRAKLIEFTKKNGMIWAQVLDDTANTIHKRYNIKFWPNVFLIDKKGTVLPRRLLWGDETMKAVAAMMEK